MIADSLDCELFGQQEFTKSGPLHTKDDYLKGSTRLHIDNRLQNEDNKAHMNAEYGAAIWHVILADPAWSGERRALPPLLKLDDLAPSLRGEPTRRWHWPRVIGNSPRSKMTVQETQFVRMSRRSEERRDESI